jgi:hypothetical protein
VEDLAMSNIQWEKVTEVFGRLEAEMLKSFLEAEGVPVELFQEGAGQSAFALNVGALGLVEVFVPTEKVVEARELIEAFQHPDEDETSDDLSSETPDETEESS